RLSRILKAPETPVLTVPKVVRVLILPYRGDNGKALYFSRYVYVITDEPKWVFDNLLIQESEGEM
ncbi:MAG: TraV family lipoprotein, partial [Candidatus Asgardarchaeia archaeon]